MSNHLVGVSSESGPLPVPISQRLLNYKLVFVILLAVILRVGVLLAFPQVFDFVHTGAVHGSDAYDAYAQNLLATGTYGRSPVVIEPDLAALFPFWAESAQAFPLAIAPDAAIPPLYSDALAGVYGLFGRGYWQVGLFHTLLDVAGIIMIAIISRRLLPRYGDWVGALAGLMYACYPYLIFQNLTLIDTPFFMFWLHAFVLLVILLRDRARLDAGTWLLALLAGLVLGLSLLTRPIMPPLALLVALWFLFRRSLWQTIARLLPVAVVGAAVLLPWIIRNYAIYDAFVPMTTTSGANFWQGNSEYTVPVFRAGYDVQWTSPQLETEDPNSREADAERFTMALAYLRDNPERIPELLWVKFLVYWSIDIAPRYNPVEGQLPPLNYQGDVEIAGNEEGGLSMEGLPPGDPVALYSESLFDQVGRTLHRIYWGGLFVLGLVGIILSARAWREVSLLWFVQIAMTLVYVFFHPSTRYRVPTDPLFFIFSAYTLVWLWSWWRTRRAA
ncbi:MAG: glycosyltransferase family 39 protein [Anaerolineae bacterium]|nr:glycosyltransferase family 39 protein [Anaerolineae bacterium]